MRRLNVQFPQIEECIRTSLFALAQLPRNPPLHRGEELLLQLVKTDAIRYGKDNSRIEFALIFDHVEEDPTGTLSRKHWPNADKTWPYILHCSETVPTIPFSLENLRLSKDYGGQGNAVYLEPADAQKIKAYLKGGTHPTKLLEVASVEDLLRAIRNHDRVTRLAPRRVVKVREHERQYSAAWLSDALKRFYSHKCQICVHDFEPRYGIPYADSLRLGNEKHEAISTDLIVVCPNHSAIIAATDARFERQSLSFRYPNGLEERLTLREHLLVA